MEGTGAQHHMRLPIGHGGQLAHTALVSFGLSKYYIPPQNVAGLKKLWLACRASGTDPVTCQSAIGVLVNSVVILLQVVVPSAIIALRLPSIRTSSESCMKRLLLMHNKDRRKSFLAQIWSCVFQQVSSHLPFCFVAGMPVMSIWASWQTHL